MKKWIFGVTGIAVVAASATMATVSGAETKTKKVDEITCEDFLAMNPNDQQRIAYWVDGYAQAKSEAAVGTVAFDKFGNPLGALIEDCKATPKETLWQKIKKKAKKYL